MPRQVIRRDKDALSLLMLVAKILWMLQEHWEQIEDQHDQLFNGTN